MAEATEYDKLQDQRLDELESLVTAEYEPPEGVEYSFPIASQGITQEQFRLMNLGQANGIIHGDNGTVNDSPDSTGYRYYLEGHDSDSETNQRNTLLLRAGTSAESIVEGFYHRLTEDMELPFPAVTTTTLYHVTLTYDPRKFKTSPINIEVWPGKPPTAYGQIHVLLHTVERRPNQLLSQATITRYRPYTAGIVAVQNSRQLPDVDSYPAGTIAVPSSAEATGLYVRSNTSPKRWLNTSLGEWRNLPIHTGNSWNGSGAIRRRNGGVDVLFNVHHGGGGSGSSNSTMIVLPEEFRVTTSFYTTVFTTDGPKNFWISKDSDNGRNGSLNGTTSRPSYTRGSFFIPDYNLAN